MFINQSFTKNKAVINGNTVQVYLWVSQLRFTLSKNLSVTRCSTWCRLLYSLWNFENHSSQSKKWILIMLSRIVTCRKNCQILICSSLKMKFLHLLSRFRGYISLMVRRKMNLKTATRNTLC